MTYENIPAELKELVQWCVWKYERTDTNDKPTKIPYNPKTKRRVSSTDPQTWCAFSEAVEAVRNSVENYAGIGFVFSNRDPYCGIDLDDNSDTAIGTRQQFIFEQFNSYAEYSPSGKGLHIIIKANVPHGRKRDAVEIYSTARFFTMTGNVFRNAPIADYNELANRLWVEMAPPRSENNGFISSLMQSQDDQSIYDIAASALNGDKFVALYNGNWSTYYPSQSEADLALIDIIAYYTQFIPQIERMFRASALGQRTKAQRGPYIMQMIERSFDHMPPPMDITAILDRLEAEKTKMLTIEQEPAIQRGTEIPAPCTEKTIVAAPTPVQSAGNGVVGFDPSNVSTYPLDTWKTTRPAGMIASLIEYYLAASPRPVYEMSLTAALGLVSGIVGRQYNVSRTGLNQYFILVAETGKGKEAVASNISRTINYISERLPAARDIMGPAEIASGQALVRHLSGRKVPCFVTMAGEFGYKLKQITDPRANSSDQTLLKVLLDLYNKSGAGDSIHPSIYADKSNNTEQVNSPAFTLVGEGVPSKFYEALDEDSVAAGLLPRLTIIEYNGPRVRSNYNHVSVQMPVNLATALEQLIVYVQNAANRHIVYSVGETDDATEMLRAIDRYSDDQINADSGEALKQIWNRTHLKVYKLAALLAVSNNFERPIIDASMVEWSASLILTDTHRLIGKFDRGEMGQQDVTDNSKQIERMVTVLAKYVTNDFHAIPTYGTIKSQLHAARIIPYGYIQRAVCNNASFKKARNGSSLAIKQTIEELIKQGYLQRATPKQLSELDHSGEAYQILKIMD